jgi:hypothetical protein
MALMSPLVPTKRSLKEKILEEITEKPMENMLDMVN